LELTDVCRIFAVEIIKILDILIVTLFELVAQIVKLSNVVSLLSIKVCLRGCLRLKVVLLLLIIDCIQLLHFCTMLDILFVKRIQVILSLFGMAAFMLVIDLVELGNLI